jgi:glycosyltransferase involved in cell wall biosynthesis
MPPRPLVSVIIPAYKSHRTIDRCLDSLHRQTYSPMEIIIVDSSPDDRTSSVVSRNHPGVKLVRSRDRLLPHAARNSGAEVASGDCFAFTDPDVYPEPQWLALMVLAYLDKGGVIVGAVACFGTRWMDVGHHLSKYDKWLPGGAARPTDIGSSANILCSRRAFELEAGFPPEGMLGDTLLSWRLARRGHTLWFTPDAVVYHDHMGQWAGLVRERFQRGAEFGRLRSSYHRWSRWRTLSHLAVTLLPFRLAKLVGRVGVHAGRAGMVWDFVRTFPIVLSGESAWLAGEASAYLKLLAG